uniref:Uncharacterized protein n=1 Tax=uncultured prokaryote TaxID=198431 RepID=A0A0H5Q6P1_9ZZZZ|nr:hypothetical protein [uncultured prokaryote]
MPLNVPPGFAIATINVVGPIGTPNFATTIGVTMSDGFGSLVDLANTVHLAYTVEFSDIMSSQLSCTGVSLFLTGDNGNGSIESDNVPVQGSNSAATAMIGMAAIAQKRTTRLGRTGRGRMFLPGVIKETEVDESGRIVAAALTKIETRADDFLANLNAENSARVAFDTPAGPVLLHSSASIDPTPITNFSVNPIVGLMRSRIR